MAVAKLWDGTRWYDPKTEQLVTVTVPAITLDTTEPVQWGNSTVTEEKPVDDIPDFLKKPVKPKYGKSAPKLKEEKNG